MPWTAGTGRWNARYGGKSRDGRDTVMISGISHITLLVHDLDAAGDFLKDIFGAEEIYASGDRQFSIAKEKYFLIGNVWICLMEGDALTVRTYNHIAFSVPDSALDGYMDKLRVAGVQILPGRSRIEGEGRSIYFYDFDNHLFELHTGTLDERLNRYLANDSPDCNPGTPDQ